MKKHTGRKFLPQNFRELDQCLQCRKAGIWNDDLCAVCRLSPIPKCEMCEVLLRYGKYIFYLYDNREDFRLEVQFNPIKELVREFTSIRVYEHKPVDNLCADCVDWELRMKDTCALCGKGFPNNKEHYKLRGNLCEPCSPLEDEQNEGTGSVN